MCCELLDCGNVSSRFRDRGSFSARSLDEQNKRSVIQKRPAYGRGPQEAAGSRNHVGKVESPDHLHGTTGKSSVRFAGFSLVLGNREAPAHCCWCYWEWARGDIPEKPSWGISHIQTSTAAQMLNSPKISLTKIIVESLSLSPASESIIRWSIHLFLFIKWDQLSKGTPFNKKSKVWPPL